MIGRILATVALVGTGCGGFTMAGPAHFKEPATRAIELIRASTSPPVFETALSAEAIANAQPFSGGFLVDLIAEERDGGQIAERACGALVLLDVQSGKPRWSHARKGQCASGVVTRERTVVTFVDHGAKTALTELDGASGNVTGSIEGGKVVAAAQAADLFVLEVSQKNKSVESAVVAYGDGLVQKWRLPVTAINAVGLEVTGDSLYAYGDGVVAVDVKTGRASKPVILGAQPQALSAVPHKDGIVFTRIGKDGDPEVTALGLDGSVRWNAKGKAGMTADGDSILLAGGEDISFVALATGAERWRAKLSGAISGRAVFMDTPERLVLVPQSTALTAFVAATGAARWTVPIRPGEPKGRHTDQVIVGNGVVVWDTWRHVVGIDPAGTVTYDVPVRSLAIAHREGRAIDAGIAPKIGTQKFDNGASLATALNTPIGIAPPPGSPDHRQTVGYLSSSSAMSSATGLAVVGMQDAANAMAQANYNAMQGVIVARRQASFSMTQRYAAISAASDYVVRPITWNLGRGFLLVRKSDGAFTEIIIGPTDVFEGAFREPSMSAFDPRAKVLLAFSEGFAPEQWKVAQRTAVELIKRHAVGFALDPAALKPAATYANTSKVPDGSYLWETDQATK